MIASISGKVIQLTKETVVIDINGLGMTCFISTPTCSSGKITSRSMVFQASRKRISSFSSCLWVGSVQNYPCPSFRACRLFQPGARHR